MEAAPRDKPPAAMISTAAVQLLHEYTGRGPTKAKTVIDGDVVEAGNTLVAEVRPEAVWLCVPQPADHPDLAVDADAAAARGSRLVEKSR